MSKKYQNWCDPDHEKRESRFDVGFLSERLVNILTEWVLTDFTIIEGMSNYQIELQRRRCHKILDLAEQIECLVKDANSIYMVREIDYTERRQKWLRARGFCFEITAMLGHISQYTEYGTNVQKYLNLQKDIQEIGSKIKKLMISDDERFKKKK